MANEKNISPVVTEPASVIAPVIAPLPANAPVAADETNAQATQKREAKINAFLDEFAPNAHRRGVLRRAIEENTEIEGSAYFQGQFKKVKEA